MQNLQDIKQKQIGKITLVMNTYIFKTLTALMLNHGKKSAIFKVYLKT